MKADEEELIHELRAKATQWDSLVGSDAKRANVLFDRVHAIVKLLRGNPRGRLAVQALLTDRNTGVRLLMASECLSWAPDEAIPVLEEIENDPGLHSVSAKYTLKSYRAGTLNLDW